MDGNGTVLIVAQHDHEWAAVIEQLTDQFGYRVLIVHTGTEVTATLLGVHADLVVVEAGGNIADGVALLTELRVTHPDIVRLLVLEADAGPASQAISQGAIFQFLRKPLDTEQVCLMIERGLETRELARRHRILSREFKFPGDAAIFGERQTIPLRVESQRFEKLVYVSEKMVELCDLARQAARTDLPILIQGETGTGKELLARAVHYNSLRRSSPLLVQNCGGMSDELLHSELFGHKRGAFTGAISDRLGLFRAADGGTVLLDEISEVSPSFQVSLLRFLQEGEVKPLGSDRTLSCKVRVVAASNRSLKMLVGKGEFRQDLYFRLKGFEFEVPPLRDRREDIPALAEFFAAKHAEALGRKILGISAKLIEKLIAYDFPGNIRELENEIRRMVALTKDGEYLTTRHLSPAMLDAVPRRDVRAQGGFALDGTTLREQVESLERQLVRETLGRHRWNQSRAAEELGLSRLGLANKIKRYGIGERD